RCKALLFPGEEDFGIVPVEANACGAPVIAFGQGGATETVVPPLGRAEPTGVWFTEQTAEGIGDAITRFEQSSGDFSPLAARRQALGFTAERFATELFAYLDKVMGSEPVTRRRAA